MICGVELLLLLLLPVILLPPLILLLLELLPEKLLVDLPLNLLEPVGLEVELEPLEKPYFVRLPKEIALR